MCHLLCSLTDTNNIKCSLRLELLLLMVYFTGHIHACSLLLIVCTSNKQLILQLYIASYSCKQIICYYHIIRIC